MKLISPSPKHNALRQRQFLRIVDRNVLASHVGFPGVAAALAPAAGFFLAAKCAADLRAAGADIHIGDAAITAAAGKEVLGLAQVVGEDRRAKPLRHLIVPGDGFLQILVSNNVEDRGERFFMNDSQVVPSRDQARTHVAAAGILRPIEPFAAIKDFASLFTCLGQGLLPFLDCLLVDERPHKRALARRVADGHLFIALDQSPRQLVADRFMDDDPSRGRAALAGGADRSEQNPLSGKIQIRAGRADDGIVPAQLGQRPTQPARDHFADVAAHFCRAGGGNQTDTPIVDQPFAHRLAVANHQAEDGRVHTVGTADPLSDLDRRNRRQRRLARGLPHRGIAAHGCQRAVPGPNRHRKIESRNNANDAERMPLLHHSMLWPLRSDGQPVSWRERPTAKSQISIISCTSPWPSATIFPASSVTSWPSSCLASRKALPSWRISSPRLGAGTLCHFWKAAWARCAVASYCSGVAVRTVASTVPSLGERLFSALPPPTHSPLKTPGLSVESPSFLSSLVLELGVDFMVVASDVAFSH